MLVIESFNKNNIIIRFKYYQSYINRMRQLKSLYSKKDNGWILPLSKIFDLESLFEGELYYKTPRWILLNTKPPEYNYNIKKYELPKLKIPLLPYQEYGTNYMIHQLTHSHFIINSDVCGLGKTVQAIATSLYFNLDKILIISPKSIRTQWKSEIKKFTGIENCTIISGTKKKRDKLYNNYKDGYCIVNYHTVMNDYDELFKKKFDMIILDEAHKVSCRTGIINTAIKKVCSNSTYLLFLTGTPIMSTPESLYGLLQLANLSSQFGKWTEFKKEYIVYDLTKRYCPIVGYRNLDNLRRKIQHYIIRRTEHEVAIQLPDSINNKLILEMDSTQIKIQNKINQDIQDLLNKQNNTKDKKILDIIEAKLKGLIAAQQAVANDPRLFNLSKSKTMIEQYGSMVPSTYKMSSKNEALIELIDSIDSKVIIFTKFERAVRLINEDLTKNKISSVMYSGKIDNINRDKNVHSFQTDENIKVFITNDAGAEGLNLQVANYVINYDQPDTPAIKLQRAGRARRVGSKYDKVFIYDLISEDSRDQTVLNGLELKHNLFDSLIELDCQQSKLIKSESN